MEETYTSIKTLVGLFIPVKFGDKWSVTIAIGHIPLGWIIVIISLIVKHI